MTILGEAQGASAEVRGDVDFGLDAVVEGPFLEDRLHACCHGQIVDVNIYRVGGGGEGGYFEVVVTESLADTKAVDVETVDATFDS